MLNTVDGNKKPRRASSRGGPFSVWVRLRHGVGPLKRWIRPSIPYFLWVRKALSDPVDH
jgi:hypothetical protein